MLLTHMWIGAGESPQDALNNGFGQALKGLFIPSSCDSMSKHISLAICIRGLYEAWSRSSPDSDTAKLIEAFITVQVRYLSLTYLVLCSHVYIEFNALLDLANAPSGYQLSPQWPGPPATKFLPWGQLAALDVP